jgi:hypothetical protein
MTLEERIAHIVAMDCLTPAERAAVILAQPQIRDALEEAGDLQMSPAEMAFVCKSVKALVTARHHNLSSLLDSLRGQFDGRPTA